MAEDRIQGNPRIGVTAYYTSHAWVEAGFDRAELFETRLGRWLFRTGAGARRALGLLAPAAGRYHEQLFVRHHAFEERLRQRRPTCVVEIGAGLSPRGIAFSAADPSLLYVEADLPIMVAAKRSRLSGVTLPPNYHLGAADLLAADFLESLPARPRPGDRVVAVTEGVTVYLKMREKRRAFENIAALLAASGGGTYLLEIYARELFASYPFLSRAFVLGLGRLVRRSFEDQLFERLEDACRFLEASGFHRAEPLDLAALNTSPYQPPLEFCPYRLVEAVVEPRTTSGPAGG